MITSRRPPCLLSHFFGLSDNLALRVVEWNQILSLQNLGNSQHEQGPLEGGGGIVAS
jgi:hypothetical protein